MFATVWPGFHKFSQVIMLYEIHFIKHYHLFFKENNLFMMSQNRHTSTTVVDVPGRFALTHTALAVELLLLIQFKKSHQFI